MSHEASHLRAHPETSRNGGLTEGEFRPPGRFGMGSKPLKVTAAGFSRALRARHGAWGVLRRMADRRAVGRTWLGSVEPVSEPSSEPRRRSSRTYPPTSGPTQPSFTRSRSSPFRSGSTPMSWSGSSGRALATSRGWMRCCEPTCRRSEFAGDRKQTDENVDAHR